MAKRNKTIFFFGGGGEFLMDLFLIFACKQINSNKPAMKKIKGHHVPVESYTACTDTLVRWKI